MTCDVYHVEPMPPQLPKDKVKRLAKVECATLGHYLHSGFADPAIRSITRSERIAGAAVTVQISGPDSTLLYHVMDQVRPGDVLVIDRTGDRTHACWGGFMAEVARIRGLAGVIVDGAITDPQSIRSAGVPTWARSTSAITTKLMNLGGSFNRTVSIGGVAVNPGDAILADDCGIVVIPPSRVDALTALALEEQSEEDDWIERLEKGEMLRDLHDVNPLIVANRAG